MVLTKTVCILLLYWGGGGGIMMHALTYNKYPDILFYRCRGFFNNPVMHRWHNFNDAIVLECMGFHDHPRPIKDCPELAADHTSSATPLPSSPRWQLNDITQTPSSQQLSSPSREIKESGQQLTTVNLR